MDIMAVREGTEGSATATRHQRKHNGKRANGEREVNLPSPACTSQPQAAQLRPPSSPASNQHRCPPFTQLLLGHDVLHVLCDNAILLAFDDNPKALESEAKRTGCIVPNCLLA